MRLFLCNLPDRDWCGPLQTPSWIVGVELERLIPAAGSTGDEMTTLETVLGPEDTVLGGHLLHSSPKMPVAGGDETLQARLEPGAVAGLGVKVKGEAEKGPGRGARANASQASAPKRAPIGRRIGRDPANLHVKAT